MITRRLRLEDHTSVSQQVADFVAALAGQAGLTSSQAYRLRLAADEIATNIHQHGYHGADGVVDLEGGVGPDRVWVSVEDDAPAFDPRSYDPAPRLAPEPASRQQEGGYGLLLALRNVDDFAYDRVGGRNRTTLTMWRPASDIAAGVTGGNTDGRNERTGRR